jgi:hypothetical protein
MKNILIATVVCVAVLFAVDALEFNGQYYDALTGVLPHLQIYVNNEEPQIKK